MNEWEQMEGGNVWPVCSDSSWPLFEATQVGLVWNETLLTNCQIGKSDTSWAIPTPKGGEG